MLKTCALRILNESPDTNVLISAALFPQSTPARAFRKANTVPFQAVICEQNLDEMKRIFTKKFPDKLPALESFISNSLLSIEIVDTPEIPVEEERSIRDMMDRPILRSAIVSGVDIILTGDKDFLESGIDNPRMMTPSDFLSVRPSSEKLVVFQNPGL